MHMWLHDAMDSLQSSTPASFYASSKGLSYLGSQRNVLGPGSTCAIRPESNTAGTFDILLRHGVPKAFTIMKIMKSKDRIGDCRNTASVRGPT